MVSLDVKQDISLPITLQTTTTESEPKLSFSDLLKGISFKKDDNSIQNGSSILDITDKQINLKDTKDISTNISLPKSTSKENFLTLLKNDTNSESNDIETLLDINPKLDSNISTKELKVLVGDAKEYLKFKISNSDGYKKSEIKELPKTLAGILELAKKFDIDISKIKIEDVKSININEDTKIDKKIEHSKSTISTQEIVSKNEKVSLNIKEKPLETMLKLSKDIIVDKKQVNQEIPKDIKVQTKQENQEIPKDIKVQTFQKILKFKQNKRIKRFQKILKFKQNKRIKRFQKILKFK